MTDDHKLQGQIGRLKLMLSHIERTLDHDAPDLKIVEKLLSDALSLTMEMREPPNPYADKTLRPGLNTVGEAAATGMIAPPEGG